MIFISLYLFINFVVSLSWNNIIIYKIYKNKGCTSSYTGRCRMYLYFHSYFPLNPWQLLELVTNDACVRIYLWISIQVNCFAILPLYRYSYTCACMWIVQTKWQNQTRFSILNHNNTPKLFTLLYCALHLRCCFEVLFCLCATILLLLII